MPSSSKRKEPKTAVVVVHGIGSQRPLTTLRGIVDAVWRTAHDDADKRVWFHPELGGIDLDLPVITGSAVPKERLPKIDFHEFYWSHLMSETRAVAVLLWLFELARKGPRLNPGIGALWWGSAIFLSFLILSVAFLAIQGIDLLLGLAVNRALLLLTPVGLVAIVTLFAALVFVAEGAYKLARATAAFTVAALVLLGVFYVMRYDRLEIVATNFLPAFIAIIATRILMGWWGVAAFVIAGLLSGGFYFCLLALNAAGYTHIEPDQIIPWSIDSQWSAVLAWLNIAAYLIFNAMFLQPYLGDAARYFRNAPANVEVRRAIRRDGVETLEHLHVSGSYDRIIVVAHSLGSVIAYDMLRAYFARIAHALPSTADIMDASLDRIDKMTCRDVDALALRDNARNLVRKITAAVDHANESDMPGAAAQKSWLITDFVTLGSPLTHAYYLMCDGNTAQGLKKDFYRRVREREMPTCPPAQLDTDGRLTFVQPGTWQRRFHHGALFGLTRWTNLYFPVSNLFWGDAIGGPVRRVFGKAIVDVPIYVNESGIADFFSHITYWDILRDGGRDAPHIQKLCKALNLEDGPDAIAAENVPPKRTRTPHG